MHSRQRHYTEMTRKAAAALMNVNVAKRRRLFPPDSNFLMCLERLERPGCRLSSLRFR